MDDSDHGMLGGSVEQRRAFADYLNAFSNADYERFSSYYADDATLALPHEMLVGRNAIVAFYRAMFPMISESLTLRNLVADNDGLAADITMKLTALVDAPDFPMGAMLKGQIRIGRIFVHYHLHQGKIRNIEIAFAEPLSPARFP